MKEFLGRGGEKSVFVNPENEQQVIKEYEISKYENSISERPNFRFGSFYIREILTLIPDVGMKFPRKIEYSDATKTQIDQRIHTSDLHKKIQEELQAAGTQTYEVPSEKQLRSILEQNGWKELIDHIRKLGLYVDTYPRNFDLIDGGIWYLDDFSPWKTDYGTDELLVKRYDREKIESHLDILMQNHQLSEFEYRKVVMYLDKLDQHFDKEKESFQNYVKKLRSKNET